MKRIDFPLLTAAQVEVRIDQITKNGVRLLIYKQASTDRMILNQVIGSNWKVSYPKATNNNCLVEIWDEETKQWIGREGVAGESSRGAADKEKSTATDAFKRACFMWGIGEELYSTPQLFIFADKLVGGLVEQNGKNYCNDSFHVSDIRYTPDRKIESITIVDSYRGKQVAFTFGSASASAATQTQAKVQASKAAVAPAQSTPAEKLEAKPETPAATATTPTDGTIVMSDDEVILIGNCRGQKYGDVKETDMFKKFLGWVKTSSTSYPDAERTTQMTKFKKLAETA